MKVFVVAGTRTRRLASEFSLDALQRRLDPIAAVLGLCAPLVNENGGDNREREELKELGLPVLQVDRRDLETSLRQMHFAGSWLSRLV